MPMPGDPSFAREERRARAREAAAAATPERIQELKSRYEPIDPDPPRPARRSSRRQRSQTVIDSAAIAAIARTCLDEHPGTWTSYAELCSAAGLDRQLALVVARHLVPEPTSEHWFRIRNGEGVYNMPTDEAERGDIVRFSPAEADRRLEEIGVRVVDRRADRRRKLVWTTTGWQLQR